jgi:hypothetical protein
MERFQIIVLVSAFVLLIVSLSFMAIMLNYAQDETWPPLMQACPDYWTMSDDGKCKNTNNLGTCSDMNEMDFTDYDACAKYKWTKKCGVTWDGLNNNPCA